MMKRSIFVCLVLLLLSLCLQAGAELVSNATPAPTPELTVAPGDHSELDAFVAKAFKQKHAAGGAVMVAKDGQLVYEYYYGYQNTKTKVPITRYSYFRVASVTKMISAIGIMTLVEQGKLDLDTDLSEYYGYTIRNPKYKDTPITLRMVMSHTSSFYDGGGMSSGKTSLQYLIDYANRRSSNFLSKKPGTYYRYSNLNGGILGSLMELVSNESINTYMTEHVFQPLGVNCAYNVNFISDTENCCDTYNAKGVIMQGVAYMQRQPYEDTVNPDKHFRITVGSVWARPIDLLRIGMMLEQEGTLDGVTILQPETVREMMMDQNGTGGITISSAYGLNINRMTNLVDGMVIYGDQGLNGGILANVYFEPENNLVFILCSNGCNTNMNDHIAAVSRKIFNKVWAEFVGE